MKEADYYNKLKDKKVQCILCPHFCLIENNKAGKCRIRKNIDGTLYALTYNKPVVISIDPIEKKPLYHFLPGTKSFSIGMNGCNFSCENCQNWELSQSGLGVYHSEEIESKEVVGRAMTAGCSSISYTYSEPSVSWEYVYDIAKIARKNKIKNVTVTNGFINPIPLKKLCKIIDGSNIDLKSIDDKFYEKVCKGRINPVLEAIKIMHKNKVWIELTNLIIPGLNDDEREIKRLCQWIVDNVGRDVPLHFSAFFPQYKMSNLRTTELEILRKAKKIAEKEGIKFVYLGNLHNGEGENTYCPECKSLLIERDRFKIIANRIKKGRCYKCKAIIPGVWE